MTTAKDITEDWVKANFDIDKERKKLNKKSDYYDCVNHSSFDYIPVDDFISALYQTIEKYRKFAKASKHAIPFIDIGTEHDYDGMALKINVIFKWSDSETDEQVIKRLIRAEKIKISTRDNKEKAKITKEEKDQKEYKRLKKKYG